MRWYPTPQRLAKFQKKFSPLCWSNRKHHSTLYHILWSCPYLKDLWTGISNIITDITYTVHNHSSISHFKIWHWFNPIWHQNGNYLHTLSSQTAYYMTLKDKHHAIGPRCDSISTYTLLLRTFNVAGKKTHILNFSNYGTPGNTGTIDSLVEYIIEITLNLFTLPCMHSSSTSLPPTLFIRFLYLR